jgi:hypothetical protein
VRPIKSGVKSPSPQTEPRARLMEKGNENRTRKRDAETRSRLQGQANAETRGSPIRETIMNVIQRRTSRNKADAGVVGLETATMFTALSKSQDCHRQTKRRSVGIYIHKARRGGQRTVCGGVPNTHTHTRTHHL